MTSQSTTWARRVKTCAMCGFKERDNWARHWSTHHPNVKP